MSPSAHQHTPSSLAASPASGQAAINGILATSLLGIELPANRLFSPRPALAWELGDVSGPGAKLDSAVRDTSRKITEAMGRE